MTSKPARTLLAYAQLGRISNAPTALADVWMGLAVAAGGYQPTSVWLWLSAAALCLYTAGMVLNDVFDAKLDATERPERPIPSGRVSLATARRIGWGLLLAGIGCAVIAARLLGDFAPAVVGVALAGLIVLYNALLKSTPFGFLAMGACRGANAALGLSVGGAAAITSLPGWLIITGLTVYVAGLTLFARSEATQSCRAHLTAGWLIALGGIGMLAALPLFGAFIRVNDTGWYCLWAVVAAIVSRRIVAAILTPQPKHVQAAVGQGIVALVYINSSLALGLVGPTWGLAILALAPIAVILQGWVRPT
jgi:4-hydroxybenzoate polyprenyltransferase